MNIDLFLDGDYAANPAPFVAFLDCQDDINGIESSISLELDRIETLLMDELSRHSSIFANTLSIVEEVKATFAGLSSATDQIKLQLDEYSKSLETEFATLETLHQRISYCENTRSKLSHLKNVLKTQKRIQDLVNLCSFDDALFLISKTEAEIKAELLDFETFKDLSSELSDMRVALEKLRQAPSLQ